MKKKWADWPSQNGLFEKMKGYHNGFSIFVLNNPKKDNPDIPKGIWGWAGYHNTHFWIDEKNKVLVSYEKGDENFVSTIKGVILRNRSVSKKDSDSFVVLRLRSPKRLSIYDPVTNQEIDLAGFGKKNIEIFYKLP